MKKLSTIVLSVLVTAVSVFVFFSGFGESDAAEAVTKPAISSFEQAVEIIKKYETLHQPKHWPLVGYGHKVLPGEKFSRTKALSEKEADALLRKDLLKNCAVFRQYGTDSLLLGVLAYNIGSGNVKKSSVVKLLKAGNRNIKDAYLAHSKYRGKVHKQIKARRIEEFDALFVSNDLVAAGQNMQKSWTNPEPETISSDKSSSGMDSLLAHVLSPLTSTLTAFALPFKTPENSSETLKTEIKGLKSLVKDSFQNLITYNINVKV